MKQRLLKSLLLLCALIVGSGTMWADDVTFDIANNSGFTANASGKSGGGADSPVELVASPITIACDNGYFSGSQLRVYSTNGGTMTISTSSGTISKIVFTCTANGTSSNGPGKLSATDYTASNGKTGTWEGTAATSVTITATAQCRITQIVVTYTTSGGGDDPSISADPTTLNTFTYVEGNGPSVAQTISVSGSNLTDNIGLDLGNNSDYEISTSQNSGYATSLNLTPTNGTVSATNVYVRLKANLAKGTHNETLTISNSGVEDAIQVSLSGSVTGQTHAVTVATGLTGGTIGANPTSAAEGATISLTANPEEAYTFGSWSVYKTGDQSTTVSVSNNQFTMPDYAVDVTATFNAKPTHTATFSINGSTTSNTFYEGQTISFPSNPADVNGKKFMGWVTSTIDGTTNTAPSFVTSATMGNSDVTYYAVFATVSVSVVTDKLTTSTFGSPSSYEDWSDKQATNGSSAVYAGNSTTYNNSIQIRTKDSNSGIVTTTTGDGCVTKVTVSWNSGTSEDRTLNIYGKTSAYSDATDLYDDTKYGTLLGSLYYNVPINNVKTTTTELTIDGNYQFIGLRSKSSAMYLDEIDIEWSDVTISDYCTTVVVTYSVTYDGNGNTSGNVPTDNTAYSPNATVTVLGNTGNLAKTGCNFGGWNTQDDGQGTNYAADETFSITANTTLYAKWINVTPTISLSSYSVEATYDETNGSLTVTCENIDTQTGVEIHWFTDATGNTQTDEPNWIDTEINTTTLNYEIAANTGAARTAYFKVYGLDGEANDVYSDIVTVTQAAYVAKTTYTLVTSVAPGKTYIIASGTSGSVYAMGYDKGNNRDAVPVSAVAGQSTSTITIEENPGVYEMVLYGPDANGYYTFYDANRTSNEVAAPGYLYAVSGSNALKTKSTIESDGKWSIAINGTTDVATVKVSFVNGETTTDRIMRFNNGNSKLFSCYTSGQQDIYLYEKADAAVATTVSKTLNAKGYATFATTTALDFLDADADGVTYSAWQIKSANSGTGVITFTQITEHVAAGTGMLLKGTANVTINLNILPVGGATLDDNLLVGTTNATDVNDNEYYGLSGYTFVPVNAGTVPAGKALLPVSALGNNQEARSFTFVFENPTTGISEVQNVSAEEFGEIFNLAGQRLNQPRKGVNIINGKRVLVK